MSSKQVVAYKPVYFKLTGSIEAALLLSQAEYWATRKYRDVPFTKTSAEWEEETGLTYWKQQSARKILNKFNFWTEYLSGTPATIHFKIDVGLLRIAVDEFLTGHGTQDSLKKNKPVIIDKLRKSDADKATTGSNPKDLTAAVNNLEQDRGISSNLIEEIPHTIIGIVLENIKKNNNNIITENEIFGIDENKSNWDNAKRRDSMKKSTEEKVEVVDRWEKLLVSENLISNFNGINDWHSKIIKSQSTFLIKTLAVRLSQNKISYEILKNKILNIHTISDLLLIAKSDKYSESDILKDLIYIYSDGLVSSWSRENKAINVLKKNISDNILTLSEIDDCLIWIKNTLNFSLSLSSIIPSIQYFRKNRIPILGTNGRHMCTYSFSNKGFKPSIPNNSLRVEDDINNFFSNQRIRK